MAVHVSLNNFFIKKTEVDEITLWKRINENITTSLNFFIIKKTDVEEVTNRKKS